MLLRILGCAALAASAVAQLSGNVITLDYGRFTGELNDSTGVINFKGIRYADAPLGDLRWRAPVSPPSQNLGDVNATMFSPACLQTKLTNRTSSALNGYSEDCLFLNVFVPVGTAPNASLPVLLYMHGGGLQVGDPDDAIADHLFQSTASPFIFVTIQFRLGSYGYLGGKAIGEDGDYNVGLLDQKATFRWVRQYISQFGGDPTRLTIWGQSGGAVAVMLHLLAQDGDNEGLFIGAIADSPPIGYQPDCKSNFTETIVSQIAKEVECDTAEDILNCLRAVDASILTNATSAALALQAPMVYPFEPCMDGSFLTSRIVPAMKANALAPVPLLFGSNTAEGTEWKAKNVTEDTVYAFLVGQYPGLTRELFDRALELYPLEDYDNDTLRQGQRMLGELRYICSAVLPGKSIPGTYQYHYDNPDNGGSGHGAELAAFFDPPDNGTFWATMRQYWTSFAAIHIPQADNSSVWRNEPNTRMFLHPEQIAMEDVDSGLRERCDFWHGISEELQT
ncbi:Alpha/Beta hydrolase protein [Schizophyllum fasciatum]